MSECAEPQIGFCQLWRSAVNIIHAQSSVSPSGTRHKSSFGSPDTGTCHKSSFGSHDTVAPKSILDPISVDEFQTDNVNNSVESFHDPQDIIFSHDFIVSKVAKFGLSTDSCINYSQPIKHFIDPRLLYDALSENKIEWVKLPQAEMTHPHLELDIPVYDPSNINVVQNLCY